MKVEKKREREKEVVQQGAAKYIRAPTKKKKNV